MTRSSFKLAIASVIFLSPCLGGCAVAVVGGMAAAGGVGYEAAQERGVNGTFEDMNLASRLNNALNNQYGSIGTTVYAGKVLLTGSSPTPQAKAQAEQIARQTDGVRMVFNEIQVAPIEGGMDAVGSLAHGSDDASLSKRLAAGEVDVPPLSAYALRPCPPGLLFGFTAFSPGQIRSAIQTISSLFP